MDHTKNIQAQADFTKGRTILNYYGRDDFQFVIIVQPGATLGEIGNLLVANDLGNWEKALRDGKAKYAVPSPDEARRDWRGFVVPLDTIKPDDNFMVVAIPPMYVVQRKEDYDAMEGK